MKCIPHTCSGTLFFVGLLETSNTQNTGKHHVSFIMGILGVPHQLPTLPKTLRPYERDYQATFSVYSIPFCSCPAIQGGLKVAVNRYLTQLLGAIESPTRMKWMNVNTLRKNCDAFLPYIQIGIV